MARSGRLTRATRREALQFASELEATPPTTPISAKLSNSLGPAQQDTSIEEADIEDVIVVGPRTSKRLVKEVAIPAYMLEERGQFTKMRTSPTNTTVSSARETSRATSADFDTPGTSPPVSVASSRQSKRKHNTMAIDSAMVSESEDDEDFKLATRLQLREYQESDGVLQSKRQKLVVADSDLDESELSEAQSVDSIALSTRPLRPIASSSKAVITNSSSSRGRATPARAAAKAAIASTKKTALKVEDSDDDQLSELSDAPSEVSFVVDDSDAQSTDVSDAESDVPIATLRRDAAKPVAATVPSAAATTSRAKKVVKRRRGRRFGRYSREDAAAMSAEIEEVVKFSSRKERERRKLEKAHPSIKTMWSDLKAIPVIPPEQAAQPTSINRRLKPFQLEGLNWMTKQEQTHYKGGLLGDEMGMGKTIQAVSLIMSDYPQKDPTLVVVPPVALMQWSSEINEYTDGKLKVLVYHGQNTKIRGMSVRDLMKFDVIMISYNSLESLYRKETKGWSRGEDIVKEDSPIHAIKFHRLILDEAHSIKQRTTGVAKACFALKGTYKWCLSGTPVQNRIGEFFSLLRFLEVRPFADYFCKRCPCSILHWELDDDHMCRGCKHSGMEHVSVFNQELLNPLTQSEDPADRKAAMAKLHLITARIMLRRLKRDHTASMELPPKEVIIHNEFFGEIERDFSSSIMTNTTRTFDTYVARGVMLNNYANIFGLIMQMRQVANHPDLLLKRHAAEGQNVLVCNVCDDVAEEAIRSQCKHDFCRACVKSYVNSHEETGGVADCPRCHIALSIDFDQPEIEQDEEQVKKSSIINRIRMENWTSSTKIEMLIYDLYKLRSKKQTLKSIVFSQFTSMLQLIEWRLRRAGFNTVMLDGSMTPIQRQKSIEHFMTNPDCEIFLVSLKAGGVALNLTEASRVFIVDPWWNPAAEWQSADRCHRIGQRRPCVITRLCIEDSVESRMVMLQEKKANMINGTINNDSAAMEKLTPEDMQFLFRGT